MMHLHSNLQKRMYLEVYKSLKELELGHKLKTHVINMTQ